MGKAINDPKHNDAAVRRSRFTIEISGGSDPKSTGGVWLSIQGGGMEFKEEANPTGADALRLKAASATAARTRTSVTRPRASSAGRWPSGAMVSAPPCGPARSGG